MENRSRGDRRWLWLKLTSPVFLSTFLLLEQTGSAVDLKPDTIEAFDHYIKDAEARMEPRFRGTHFLWTDEVSGCREQLIKGDILIRPANGNGLIAVKNGLIEDWMAAVFIPHANLKTALMVVQDYDRHPDIYKPDVAQARTQSRQGDDFRVYMRIVKAKFFLSDVLNTEHEIHFSSLDSTRTFSRSYSTRIAEVSSPGKPGEFELPVGRDRGLLWRLNSYWFFEERDGGVFIAAQSVSLTRDIPLGMGKILGPIIRDVPGESLQNSLKQTRAAILERGSR